MNGIQEPGNFQDGIKAQMRDQSIEEAMLYNSLDPSQNNCP